MKNHCETHISSPQVPILYVIDASALSLSQAGEMREGIGVARRSRKAQGFGVSLVFFCVVGVAAVPPLSIAVHDTDVSSSPELELCKVDLYQRGFGVAKGHRQAQMKGQRKPQR